MPSPCRPVSDGIVVDRGPSLHASVRLSRLCGPGLADPAAQQTVGFVSQVWPPHVPHRVGSVKHCPGLDKPPATLAIAPFSRFRNVSFVSANFRVIFFILPPQVVQRYYLFLHLYWRIYTLAGPTTTSPASAFGGGPGTGEPALARWTYALLDA